VLARLQAWTLKPAVADLAEVARLQRFGAR
jgi:hypothetical protein